MSEIFSATASDQIQPLRRRPFSIEQSSGELCEVLILTPSLDGSYEETIERAIPLGRGQTPEDIGKLAVFYATNRNVTGQALAGDGGILQNVL